MTRYCVVVLAVTQLGAASCAGSEETTSAVRNDSAGLELVTNFGDRVLDWEFRMVARIGGEESGPAAFYRLWRGRIATDGSGRIYVLDGEARRLVAFSSDGSFLWAAGRPGSGPGEFRAPIYVTVHFDTVEVLDGGNGRIELFTEDGSYRASRAFGFTPLMTPQFRYVGRHTVVYLQNVVEGTDRFERLLLLTSRDTVQLAAQRMALPRRVRFQSCGFTTQMSPIFTPSLIWASEGARLVVNTEGVYRMTEFRQGRPVRVIRRVVAPRDATPELAAAEYPDGIRFGACRVPTDEVVGTIGFEARVPAVRWISLSPDGRTWVQRTRGSNGWAAFDVFTDSGEYLGSLKSAPIPHAFLPSGDVVGVETDEVGVQRVVVYRVVGGSRSRGAATP
jgi:hypothetical protein